MGSGNGVVQHALHAIAIAGIAGRAQQVARDLEVPISSARGLEAGVRGAQARIQQAFARGNKRLIRAPATGGKTLLMNKLESVLRGAEVFLFSQHKVGLHR